MVVPQRDRRFDGGQRVPKLAAPPVDVDRLRLMLERHLTRVTRQDPARLTQRGQTLDQ
jgi:hypothetical protein